MKSPNLNSVNSTTTSNTLQYTRTRRIKSNPNSKRYLISTEIIPKDMRQIEKIMRKARVSKSVVLRALVRMGLEEAERLNAISDDAALMKIVRLGRL